jgi:hypothetical protein
VVCGFAVELDAVIVMRDGAVHVAPGGEYAIVTEPGAVDSVSDVPVCEPAVNAILQLALLVRTIGALSPFPVAMVVPLDE